MAYAVSQLRKQANGTNTYMQKVNVMAGTFSSPNKFTEENPFQDFCLLGDFKKGEVYYLRFMIHRIPNGWYSREFAGEQSLFASADDLTITLLLKETSDEDENQNPPQVINTFTIESLAVSQTDIASNTKYFSYTTVFIPARQAGVLGFRISRTAYDALAPGGKYRRWLLESSDYVEKFPYRGNVQESIPLCTQGDRIIYQGANGDICLLKNIVPENTGSWLKMGFQSRPGTLIVVNKCPIRVGRSGIYEINNGMTIDSFMITAPQGSDNSKIDAFLLDYAYNKS